MTENFTGRAIAFDFDGDHDLDLLLTYGPQPADSLYSGLNRFYRQDDSAWVDVTAETGLARLPPASNAAVGDIDGDGYLDLYLCLFGKDRLLRNDEGRRWLEVTDSAGIANDLWASEAVFFDANGDGFLDLYVANYVVVHAKDTLVCKDPDTGLSIVCNPLLYDPAPNKLLLNDGTGRFHDATESLGLADTTSRSLGVTLLDANSNGFMDLLVLSDRSPNLLYLNIADSGFVQAGVMSGAALATDGTEPAWNQVLPIDANEDGSPDLLFMRRDGKLTLLLNDGAAHFFEGNYQTGLFQPRFPYTATSAAVLDLDFDGSLDLLLADVSAPAGEILAPPDTLSPDSRPARKMTAAGRGPERKRRMLLSGDDRRYHPVGEFAPMILDTTLLLPRFSGVAPDGPSVDFLARGTFDSPVVPMLLRDIDPARLKESPAVPEPGGTFSGIPEPGPGGADTLVTTTQRSLALAVPGADIVGYEELDTLIVRQEAAHYVVADLTGNGIQEIIAVYPVGLFRVWGRILERGPRYLGIWLVAEGPGKVVVGTQLQVTSHGLSRHILVTDANPRVIYLPRRARRVAVALRWPDGHVSRYQTRQLNRYYRLGRQDEGL